MIGNYIKNNYFPEELLLYDMKNIFTDEASCQNAFEVIKDLQTRYEWKSINESQLEDNLIKPILGLLGYEYIPQEIISVQDKKLKPDYLLFPSEAKKSSYLHGHSMQDVLLILEAKAWDRDLNGKVIKDSPHLQLVQYNLFLNVRYGMLTNGRVWRLYDLNERKSEKIFFEIDLNAIIYKDDYEAFRYFYYIFRKEYFLPTKDILTPAEKLLQAKQNFILQMEDDLKEVIYGRNSIIEKIGRVLYKHYPRESTKTLFDHALILAYRLLFIAYFESRFSSDLFDNHDHYKHVALKTLYENLKKGENSKGWNTLLNLFVVLDEGSVPFKIPLLNGGLFENGKAPLLDDKNLFSNEDLLAVLRELLQGTGLDLGLRNFAMISVTHIGNIYEGLLQYTFRVADEVAYYLEYSQGKEDFSGYFDTYDYHQIANAKKTAITLKEEIPAGSLYLVNTSNSRKMSASYYTPQQLSRFMVEDAVQAVLSTKGLAEDILNLRILDNACGSGHFLVEFLDLLTEKVYTNITDETGFEYLMSAIASEKAKIKRNLEIYNLEHMELDELQILKRLLLKKTVYGVDLNMFAVELTRLSLWLKTFIFGTPLSFIEHHIKQGNALIGSSIAEGQDVFHAEVKDGLFLSQFQELFAELGAVSVKLATLPDNTSAEIEESKRIYKSEILPKQEKLSQILNLITYQKMKNACLKSKTAQAFPLDTHSLLTNLKSEIYEGKNSTALAELADTAEQYQFFHYDTEFPESQGVGFHIVMGNPPWDKVKFDDKDYFPQYRSNYRTMTPKGKAEVASNLLAKPSIKQDYGAIAQRIATETAYYKKQYPLNAGAGDTNLFRLFIERNLSLLAFEGRLVYLTPSAWTYEEGSISLRKHIFDNLKLNYFYQFENREAIFHDVHRSYKFAVWSLNNTPYFNESVPTIFMETNASCLYEENIKTTNYPITLSRALYPDTYLMLEVGDPYVLKTIQQMYGVAKPLDPTYFDFRRELDMTNDNDLFIESKKEGLFNLYEGKMVHQFNPNFAPAQYWVEENALRERLKSKELSRMVDNIYACLPAVDPKKGKRDAVLKYLHVEDSKQLTPAIVYDYVYPRLAFRDIASNTNERSLISGIIPPYSTAGNTLWLSIPKKYMLGEDALIEVFETPIERVLWMNALLNALPIDFIIRHLIDIHVNKTYLMQLPLLQPTDAELQTPPYAEIWRNALALTLYNEPSFANLPQAKGIDVPKYTKDIHRLQVKNDILIAKLYGLTAGDIHAMTDTFKVLSKNYPEYIALLKQEADRCL